MLKSTTHVLTRRFLLSNQDVRQIGTAAEVARQRRSLKDRVAVITASTDGIGFAMAQRLAVDGAHVVISSRHQKNVDEALAKLKSEGLSVSGMVCHAGVKEDRTRLIEKTVAEFGGFDILISNAAVNPGGVKRLLNCTEDVWDKIFDVNVKSSFFLAKEALPHMEKRGKASIIFNSSILGYTPNCGIDFMGAYALSKTAVLGLTKLMAMELGPRGVRVNCICPGLIDTRFGSAITQDERSKQLMQINCPLQRNGMPEEMAGLASFLASDDSSYITGSNIVAAGGIQSSF
ncbi:dehydrogenase/reductase SDR family member 4-like isoform X2 [Daphnia pulex]|uniref:dehydrogenase/reductase SDR family member 4-like isoform X2 n=1 Tax=Daphnia pulex TaxID=6669 RepID=UPI001EDCB9D5|nr:dehydrogenase/reductase SDR family member 4-like isoform X2 [Daphnia pulex]